jgi:hypothetical protein
MTNASAAGAKHNPLLPRLQSHREHSEAEAGTYVALLR